MTPLDFLFGAGFTILGFGLLSFSFRFADRLPLLAVILIGMKAMKEPTAEIMKAISIFFAVLGAFLIVAMTGSMLFAKGLIWLLQL